MIFLNQEMLKFKLTITLEHNLKVDINGQLRKLMMILKRQKFKRSKKMVSQDFKDLIFVSQKTKNLARQKK
jgi:hypothetical protein